MIVNHASFIFLFVHSLVSLGQQSPDDDVVFEEFLPASKAARSQLCSRRDDTATDIAVM